MKTSDFLFRKVTNTSIPCDSEALGLLVEQWAARIASSSGTTVEAIVTHAEIVRAALRALTSHGRKARQMLAMRSGLSRSMMSKLETIGRHAELLRPRAGFLPPSLSSLYALACKPSPALEQALMMDLRGKSRAEIKALFAEPSAPKPTRKLMTILVPPDLNEAARCALIADIGEALMRITEQRRVDLDVSLPGSGPKIEQVHEARRAASSPAQAPPQDQTRDHEPAESNGDAPDTKPLGLMEHAGQASAGGQGPNFFTGENPPERQDLTAHCRRSHGPSRGAGPSPVKRLEPSAPSPRPPPLSVHSREREDIYRRIAHLESTLMRRLKPQG